MTTPPADRADDLLRFIDAAPTPYHAVMETIRRLEAHGFVAEDERAGFRLSPGARRYVVKHDSTIVAFEVGRRSPALGGFRMIGAHTDSPTLKLKPVAPFSEKGWRQVGVEVYGGVLLHTWLDRDLSLAGRVAVRGPSGVERRFVDLGEPLLRVPSLAIHLYREVNEQGLILNPQRNLPPVFGLEDAGVAEDALLAEVAARAGVDRGAVLGFDLNLYEAKGGARIGVDRSLVSAARLDNLASSHAAVTALIEAIRTPSDATRVIVLYDHEEIGSQSAQGAHGPFLRSILGRVAEGHPEREPEALDRALAGSFFVSADMAHGIHPNYTDKHEPRHAPKVGGGPVIKVNANQSYATDAISQAIFTAACQEAGFAPQVFVTRTDLRCGSTIGPIAAAQLGVRTVDVGNPMLSMHSARELAGASDVDRMVRALIHVLR